MKRCFHMLIFAGLGLCLAGCGNPKGDPLPTAPLAARISLSTNIVHVGDRFVATLTVFHPTNATPKTIQLERDRDIKVVNREETSVPAPPIHQKTTITYTLASFAVGNHLIATGKVAAVTAGKVTHEVPFPDALITVESLLKDPNVTARDIKDNLPWLDRFPFWVLPLILFILVLAIVAAVLAVIFLRPKKEKIPKVAILSPQELAIKALRDLEAAGLIESHEVEPFYVELSKIIREYLERRFQLRAPEQTTEEFIRATASSDKLQLEHRQLVVGFLEQSDLVKFARHEPGEEEMRSGLGAGYRLVEETRPLEVTPP